MKKQNELVPGPKDCEHLLLVSLLIVLLSCIYANPILMAQTTSERPNIVWLVSEDNSKHYVGLYGDGGAPMPNLERLADHGILFNHAFSNAPVCSVARSTIISGCYAPRIGAQYHRRTEFAPMPQGLEMFPFYLKRAGYYTTNNAKEDYNLIKSKDVWDESSKKASYQNRQSGQPFFHVQNFHKTHEGQLHFSLESMQEEKTRTDPESITPFPYHPNTKTFRYTAAKLHDHHLTIDEQIGEFVQQLEQDGLLANTFIFYYGDHGGVLPGSKGYIHESGVHIPMVVYIPEKWKHLVPAEPGSRTDAFVQFIDLGPTVLNLAGIPVPEQMDGTPFLGPGITNMDWENRNTTFSYADRFDEKYDLVRAIRKGKFKYIRNYQPFNVDALYNFYRYKMLAYQEWKELFLQGKLNKNQAQFFQPRTSEALYNIEEDPHEMANLAMDPSYAPKLRELRAALQMQVKAMPDLSFYPEPYFLKKGISNPVRFGQDQKADIADLIDIADLSLLPFSKANKGIKKALKSKDPWKRYWGLIVCSSFGQEAIPFISQVKKISLRDSENLNRVRAAEFLGLVQSEDPKPLFLACLRKASTLTEANLIMNSMALFKEMDVSATYDIPKTMFDPAWIGRENDLVYRRWQYLTNN